MGLHQCPSERKGEGVPVRSLRVPSHVPSPPQTAAKVRGFSPIASGFTAETDWLLEGPGFEPSVPRLQVELGASGGARCDDAAPALALALAAPADIAVKVAEIRFPARGVGPGRPRAGGSVPRLLPSGCRPRTLLQAAYAGRTDGGIRCGLRGRGSSGWPHGMPRPGLGGRGRSRPRPREVPPFRSPM